MPADSTCLVVLTDLLYLPGTLRLIESWQQNNPPLPIIALSRDESALADPRLSSLCEQSHLIDATSYQDIRPFKKSRSKRHAQTFFKFEAFRDFGHSRNLYLDSDILCLRPCPVLTQPIDAPLAAAIDTGFRKTRGYKGHAHEINTGVLSIQKSIQGSQTIERLKAIAIENPGRSGYNSSDQGIINKWIHASDIDLQLLPSSYNLIKKDYANTDDLASCHLLHYCSRKPWFEGGKEQTPLDRLWAARSPTQIP